MFNPKTFKTETITPNLVGGLGQGGVMDSFNNTWRMKKASSECWVIGKKEEDGKGCFSVIPNSHGWEIAFYIAPAKEVFVGIKAGNLRIEGEHFNSDPRNKYLALDLIKILKEV